ncbi:Cytochrome P450 [Micromonospora haikouensis]|uniref:Cytochrome P450 n=1 Tax=Micromonospora haikouensis TaxID=686309 RepID=A0A1C4XKW4_9ACTN|nr:cytochrome P450 [Micromonospora haikouensis]SCF09026.1 Cytochrome P450 [Micromonospora haikouensis]
MGRPPLVADAPPGEPEAEELVRFVLAPGTVDDPFAYYRRLRDLAPVYRSATLGVTLLSRFADCQRVLTDSRTFPVVDVAWMRANQPQRGPSPAQEQFMSSLFFQNPPAHTRLRRLLARGFSARQLLVLRDPVRDEVARVLDDLAGAATADFQQAVAVPLALRVLGGLLGVPVTDQDRTWELLREAIPGPPAPGTDPAQLAAVLRRSATASEELVGYFSELAAARRVAPRDDLISACTAEHADDPDGLTDRELGLAILPIFGSGVTTLSDTLGNAAYAFATNPRQLARVRRDPAAAAAASTEVLRYGGNYHIARRYAARTVEFDDVTVPEGSVVVVLLSSANRDPARFADAEAFDVGRPEIATLALGAGIHHCLGAALARLVLEEFCAALHRLPALRLAGVVRWRPSLLFFGPMSLPLSTSLSA